MNERDTIYALSSGRPPSAIAVVRISGARAGDVFDALVGRRPQPRHAMLANLKARDGGIIDEALVLWFPAPHSETGEDVVELQPHGSRAALALLFDELAKLEGFRPALGGEFTRRAVMNGKLDLTSAEGLLDLINAETEGQRHVAMRHLKGQLGHRAEHWRAQLIEAMALIEAGIDFSDEGDVPTELVAPALQRSAQVRAAIEAALGSAAQGERVRDGLVVAIAGAPNVGKSTLMNLLARRDVAIVSPIAGTTRDVIEVHLDLGGWPVTLLDTAGLRDSDDAIEQEGVRRARARMRDADLVLWLADAAGWNAEPDQLARGGSALWRILTKIDAVPGVKDSGTSSMADVSFAISARTGEGVSALVDAVAGFAETFFSGAEAALVTRHRQRELLAKTSAALGRAEAVRAGDEELVAEELRSAAQALGHLTGRVGVEDILDVVFRDFCIGK